MNEPQPLAMPTSGAHRVSPAWLIVKVLLIALFIHLFNCFMLGAASADLARGLGLQLTVEAKFDGFGAGIRPLEPSSRHLTPADRAEYDRAEKLIFKALNSQYQVVEGPSTFMFGFGNRTGMIGAGLCAGIIMVVVWWRMFGPRLALAPLFTMMVGWGLWIGIFIDLRKGHEYWGVYNGYVLLGTYGLAGAQVWWTKRARKH